MADKNIKMQVRNSTNTGWDVLYPQTKKANITDYDGMANPMTTAGDIIYGGASGTPTRLAKGTAGQALVMNTGATAPEWGTVNTSKQVGSTFTLGTASTSFTISGLDINTDGGKYEIVIENVTVSASSYLKMFINGDSTDTNYYSGFDTAVTKQTFNGNQASYTLATTSNSRCFIDATLSNNKFIFSSLHLQHYADGVSSATAFTEHKGSITNVTSITFIASAGNINTATVKIYKR